MMDRAAPPGQKGAWHSGGKFVRGPALMFGAILLFGVLDANSKLLSGHHPLAQVLTVRFVVLLALVLLLRRLAPGVLGSLATRNPRLNLARAVAMLGSACFFFLAFRDLPLVEGYLVFFTAPLIVLLASAVLLRERVSALAWAWCAVGFGGVALALAPGFADGIGRGPLMGYVYALLGTGCYAAVFLLNRQLRNEPGIGRVLFWPALLGFLVMTPFGIAEWQAPTALAWAQMVGAGVAVAAATVMVAEAFRHAPAARLAPISYTGMIWSVAFDALFWGHAPALVTLAGAGLVVLACVMSERAARQ
jgi:drug/metabolite transporter (DMT)-like permease